MYSAGQVSGNKKARQSQILTKNKNMLQHIPLLKKRIVKEKNQIMEFSIGIVRMTGENLRNRKKQVQEERLRVKFNKLEIRRNKGVRNI